MASVDLHELCNKNILHSMVTTNTTGKAMFLDQGFEKIKYSFCTIVVVGPNPSDKSRISINKSMDDNIVFDQTW
jgi:hypothetical protein